MHEPFDALESDEYLHLAMHASARKDYHAALLYLRSALRLDSGDDKALYLLAVQHAELGLIDRAIDGLHKVLERRPALDTAKFQLALLLLGQKRMTEAKRHLQALRSSGDDGLRACADALIYFADGEVVLARQKVARALSEVVITRGVASLMKQFLESTATADPETTTSASDLADQDAILRAYRRAPGGAA